MIIKEKEATNLRGEHKEKERRGSDTILLQLKEVFEEVAHVGEWISFLLSEHFPL